MYKLKLLNQIYNVLSLFLLSFFDSIDTDPLAGNQGNEASSHQAPSEACPLVGVGMTSFKEDLQ